MLGLKIIILCGILFGLSLIGRLNFWQSPQPVDAYQGTVNWPSIFVNEVTDGLSAPVDITNAGDGSNRLFVVEQAGRIKIIKNGTLLNTPFLDLTGKNRVLTGSERGLLGLAFPPGYATKGYFYVNYTRQPDGATIVARYFRDAANPDLANPDSEQILLKISQPAPNHNGGKLAFGLNDNFLYISTGDGGSGNDPNNHGQRTDTLLGKILRIDPETTPPNRPYNIPASNPFVGSSPRDEIWALGLRNPWRFSFDRETGDIYIGDVGQGAFEEIDFQPAASTGGENYGWKIFEGPICRPPTAGCIAPANYVPPIHSYAHPNDNCASVTGGHVYRGPTYPDMQGIYFFAGYCNGQIWGLQRDNGGMWQAKMLLTDLRTITSFGEDEAGELYIIQANTGTVYQITGIDFSTLTERAYLPIMFK